MSSVKRRLIAGLGANAFAKICSAIIPLVSVPIYLTHWSAQLYGDWILLNALPSYFMLSDIGFGSAAGNEMTMLVASGNREEALSVFQSVWVLSTALSSAVAALLVGVIWFLPINKWLHISSLTSMDTNTIVLLLGLSVLFGMQETLFQGVFRCVGKYAFGTLAKSIISSASFCGIMIFVIIGMSPLEVAAEYLVLNATGTIVLWMLLRRNVVWLRFGARYASTRVIRRLFSPAVSFMSFPIGNAISLQGILVVIGHMMGPIAVITYNTARTISRTAVQAMQLINNSVWPEVSTAFGAGDISLAKRIHRRFCQLSIFLCVLIIVGCILWGPFIWRHWTMGRIPVDPVLLYILLAQLFFASLWFTSSVILAATNQHQGFAKVYLISTGLSLVLAGSIMQYSHTGLRGAACAMVIGEVLTSLYVLQASLKLVDDNLRDFLISMLHVPSLGIIFRSR